MKTKVMKVSIIALCTAITMCACVTARSGYAVAGEEHSDIFGGYLAEMGARLNCHFTVESVGASTTIDMPNGKPLIVPVGNNTILDGMVNVGSEDIKNIDAMVSFLNKVSIQWDYPKQEIHLLADKIEKDKTIIRIRDARLSDVAGYVLNKKVSVEYDGNPDGLLKLLSNKEGLIQPQVVFSTHSVGNDYSTPIRVAVKDTPIRDLLTECISLSNYNRIIWSSKTDGKSKSPLVTAVFSGSLDLYSADYLVRRMEDGSDLDACWAVSKIEHQESNSYDGWKKGERKLSGNPELVARNGLITPDVKRALIPALSKRLQSNNPLVRQCAEKIVKKLGLLMDKEAFLKTLDDADEEKAAKALSAMLEKMRVDPQISEDIWSILGKAHTDYLKYTCLRYPWLFEVKSFDLIKERVLIALIEDFSGGVFTNLNTALIRLAQSDNPLAKDVFPALCNSHSEKARAMANVHLQVCRESHKMPNGTRK
jgi:hypothetical protein